MTKNLNGTVSRRLVLNELLIPPYQRELVALHVKRITENFDKQLVNHPTISYRENKYWIVDGQHTVRVLINKLYKKWDCFVYYGLTKQQEAALWTKKNTNQQKPRGDEKFYSSFDGQLNNVPEIVRITREAGLTIERIDGEGVFDPTFTQPWELVNIYKYFEKKNEGSKVKWNFLFDFFISIIKLWKTSDIVTSSAFMRALSNFVWLTREIDDDLLISYLSAYSARKISDIANKLKVSGRNEQQRFLVALIRCLPKNVVNNNQWLLNQLNKAA